MKEVNKNRKDEILSHHTKVNIDEIWAAIEPQVDIINAEKKRKKRFIIFFLLGAALLASSGLYMWQNETELKEKITTIEVEVNNAKALTEETSKSLQEELTKANTETQSPDNKIVTNKNNIITEEHSLIKTDSSFPIETKNASDKFESSQALPFANASSDNPIDSHFNIDKNKKTDTDKGLLNKKIAETKSPNIPETTKAKILTISPQISTLKQKISSSMPDVGELKPPLPGGKLNFALAVNTGISFINRSLYSNIDGESSPEALRLRRASETSLEAIHYGLRGKLTHKSGFSLSTGGQYTVLSERYDNNNLVVETDSIEGIIKRVVNLNGDTIDMTGLVPRTMTYNYEKQIYNRYRMIDIPFIVGFEGGMDKWSLGIQAGVFVNLALKTSGQIRNTATEDLDIGANQSDVFKSKLGLSYYGGIYIRRELSPYLDITIAPHGRFFAKEFNVSNYAVSQKYSLIGLQAGLSYRFGY